MCLYAPRLSEVWALAMDNDYVKPGLSVGFRDRGYWPRTGPRMNGAFNVVPRQETLLECPVAQNFRTFTVRFIGNTCSHCSVHELLPTTKYLSQYGCDVEILLQIFWKISIKKFSVINNRNLLHRNNSNFHKSHKINGSII